MVKYLLQKVFGVFKLNMSKFKLINLISVIQDIRNDYVNLCYYSTIMYINVGQLVY